MKIEYCKCKKPEIEDNYNYVELSDDTIKERYINVKELMLKRNLDCIVVYADREHGSNFEYLTGFIPRFEEAVMVINKENTYLLLGNENMKMAKFSRIKCKEIHVPYFSLVNQPMRDDIGLIETFKKAGIKDNMKIGTVGWKVFTSLIENNRNIFEIPSFIIETLKKINIFGVVENHTDLFMKEIRTINNANEIAHYAYGAALSSNCILDVYQKIDIGIKDIEIASLLEKNGQPHSVTTICTSGDRYLNANLYPREKEINKGDKISITTGYKGGLSSRCGYIAYSEKDLDSKYNNYLNKIVIPYFKCYCKWLETIQIGINGNFMYETVLNELPQEIYHWELNPGHLIQDEEWLSSPIYKNSTEIIRSGMMFQIDIIPSISGYAGISAEECVCIADTKLRNEIENKYPELYANILRRKKYIKDVLGINIGDDVLPLSNAVAYLNPFLLNKDYCLRIVK